MAQHRIAVLVGSLRRESHNRRLAEAVARMVPPAYQLLPSRIDDLPLYNQDDDGHPVEAVRRLKEEIAASRGVLFFTPEYNRSVPGVLKNAIDLASRPYGHSAWKGKPAAIIGVSVGPIGTALAQQHLRNTLAYLDMPVLAQPEAFIQAKEGLLAADGSVGEASRAFVQSWVDAYIAFLERHASA